MVDKEILANASRDTLSLYFENTDNYKKFVKILEEKSDYEVMHLVATGKFPSHTMSLSENEVIERIFSKENYILSERLFVNPIRFWADFFTKYNPGNIINAKFTEVVEKLPNYSLYGYANKIHSIDMSLKSVHTTGQEREALLKLKDVMVKQIDRNGDTYKYEDIVKNLENVKDNLKSSSSIGAVIAKFSGNVMLTMGTLAATALVIYFGYKMYQRFFSDAGKACNNYSGELKTKCMKKYRSDAIKKQIQTIEEGMVLCERTNDINRCQEMLHEKIRKLKAQLRIIG